MVVRIALAGTAAVALLGLLLLALRVNGESQVELEPEVLARAKSRYERAHRTPSPVTAPAPTPAPATKPTPAPEYDDEPEPPVDRWRPKPIPSIPQPKLAVGDLDYTEFKRRMDDANHAYDQERFEEAIDNAKALLELRPKNPRMLRIVVSANCILGNADEAARYYDELPAGRHRREMATRCRRYEVELE